jgi:hypothetical protein
MVKIAEIVYDYPAVEFKYAGKIDNLLQNELIDVLHSVFKTTDGLFSATIDATNVEDGFLIEFNWNSGATTSIFVTDDEELD